MKFIVQFDQFLDDEIPIQLWECIKCWTGEFSIVYFSHTLQCFFFSAPNITMPSYKRCENFLVQVQSLKKSAAKRFCIRTIMVCPYLVIFFLNFGYSTNFHLCSFSAFFFFSHSQLWPLNFSKTLIRTLFIASVVTVLVGAQNDGRYRPAGNDGRWFLCSSKCFRIKSLIRSVICGKDIAPQTTVNMYTMMKNMCTQKINSVDLVRWADRMVLWILAVVGHDQKLQLPLQQNRLQLNHFHQQHCHRRRHQHYRLHRHRSLLSTTIVMLQSIKIKVMMIRR